MLEDHFGTYLATTELEAAIFVLEGREIKATTGAMTKSECPMTKV
jgi:hypothetical protein